MNSKEFLDALNSRLKRLPKEEREEAMNYYREYLEEGSADELGSPEEVARQILEQCAVRSLDEKEKRSGLKTFWIVLLAVFAVPMALPIAIALGAVIFALLITLAVVIVSVAASGIAVIASGIYVVFLSVSVVSADFVNMLMSAGVGFILIGTGILLLIGIFYAAKYLIRLFSVLLGKFVKRGEGNE